LVGLVVALGVLSRADLLTLCLGLGTVGRALGARFALFSLQVALGKLGWLAINLTLSLGRVLAFITEQTCWRGCGVVAGIPVAVFGEKILRTGKEVGGTLLKTGTLKCAGTGAVVDDVPTKAPTAKNTVARVSVDAGRAGRELVAWVGGTNGVNGLGGDSFNSWGSNHSSCTNNGGISQELFHTPAAGTREKRRGELRLVYHLLLLSGGGGERAIRFPGSAFTHSMNKVAVRAGHSDG
jgi:hypothetical protein